MSRNRTDGRAQGRASGRPRAHAPDYLLMTAVMVLCLVGLIAVYSSSYVLGEAQFGDANYFVKRQAIFLGIGLAGMLVVMRLPYQFLQRFSPVLMLGALAGLALVLVPGVGVEANGARRWIEIGPLPPLQPSEFAKLAVLIYMAAWLSAKGDLLHNFSLGVIPFVSMVGIVGALIVLEPDLGTAIMVAVITGTLFFVAGARLFHVAVLGASGMLMTLLLILAGGYRVDRITAFLDAEADPSGVGFHALQLLVAFGSGGFTGLGLGVSRQKFFYVPGSHTDGILAIIGEELGYIGVSVLMALFLLLIVRGWMIARRSDTTFGSLIAVGIVAWVAFQALINIGGVTRMLPLTGIPLPFISYGGSSTIFLLIAVGVLLSVSRYTTEAAAEEVAEVRGVRSTSAQSRAASTRSPQAGGAR
jgi:cell division protein FtsW